MIPQLIRTAKALKQARRMQQEFMLMWALDQARHAESRQQQRLNQYLDQFSDPSDHNWKIFYRGSVLDD
ncbi:MAG: hypothetical protein KatS3mg104_0317 [Phycisphaerae bacterium]|nr:MAG: hypothetical protein KatS3mg104_0317 [Phycisphaerae bacterium]